MRTPLSALKGGGRVVRGTVATTGAVTSGTGFTVTRVSAGVYTVTFLAPFSAPPVVTLTDESNGVNDGAETSIPTALSFTVRTYVMGTGAPTDNNFGFVATEQER